MDESAFEQPSAEQLSAFAEGDPIAKDEIARLALPQLVRWAWRHFWNLPRDEVQSVVHGALAEILSNHERYDLRQSSFTTYAINLIRLRLIGLYQALKKIKEFQDSTREGREKLHQTTYNHLDTEELELRIARDQFFEASMDRLEDAEKGILRLMLRAETQQGAFVEVLMRYGPVTDPAKEVKNMKARLLRKLQAIARDMGYEAGDLIGEENGEWPWAMTIISVMKRL